MAGWVRRVVTAIGPVVVAAAVLLPFAAAGVLPGAFVVLGVSLALTGGRIERRAAVHPGWRGVAARVSRVPVVVVALAGLGWLLRRERPLGDLLVVAVVFGALLARRAGPRANAFGRALLLPLITVFVTPVPVGDHTGTGLLWVLLVAMVATAATTLPALLPPPPLSTVTLRREAARGRAERVHRRARELDAHLPSGAWPARLALLRVQQAVDDGVGAAEALDALDAEIADLRPATAEEQPEEPQQLEEPEQAQESGQAEQQPAPGTASSARRAAVITRLATQSAVAVALALAVGQLVFPRHWTWTVVTALTLTVGARNRGDVALRGLQRLGGALVGTTASTLLAAVVGPHRDLSVAVLLVVLCAGVLLRDSSYAWWAACVTAVLGLLFGLLGQPSGVEVLGERLVAILVGAVCAVAPAFLLRPVRTHLIVRRRAGDWLAAVRPLLDESTGPEQRVPAARAAEALADELAEAVRPIAVLRYPRERPEPEWRDAAFRGATVARRVALGDDSALVPLRRAYRTIGKGLRPG